MQRCLANNSRQRASVMNDVKGVFDPNIPFSSKNQRKNVPAIFHAIMINISIPDILRPYGDGRQPHLPWPLECARAGMEYLSKGCYGMEQVMSANLERCNRKTGRHCASDTTLGSLSTGPNWSQSKGKTGSFERYIAAQCIKPGMQMVLALLHLPALEDTGVMCARPFSLGAKIGTVMLDREFSTDVIRMLGDLGLPDSASTRPML